jgi:hypothetical protein
MHPEIQESLIQSMEDAFPESQRPKLTPEQVDSYTLDCRIWAIQEPDAFEQGVTEVIKHFASQGSSSLVEDLIGRYSPLQIAWMTNEALRRYFV